MEGLADQKVLPIPPSRVDVSSVLISWDPDIGLSAGRRGRGISTLILALSVGARSA